MAVASPARPRGPGALAVGRPTRVSVAVAVAAGAFALAALSLLWQRTPGFDAMGWLNWARSFVEHGSFSTRWYPSWKPLPFVFGVPLSLAGGAVPALWLVLVRGVALLSLALAFRLARRLAGPVAGVVAVAGVLLLPGWAGALVAGRVEPMLLGFILLAVERHAAGHRLQALGLGLLVGLARNEAWPLLAAYAVFCAVERPRRLPAVVLGLAVLPAGWLGGDLVGSRDALHGSWLARGASNISPQLISGHPVLYVAEVAVKVLPVVWMVLALFALLDGARRRAWLVPTLTVAAALWLAFDVVGAALHYPGDPRFMSPAGGVLAVAAGVGAGRVLALARRRVMVQLALVAALVAVAAPAAIPRLRGAVDEVRHIKFNDALTHQLDEAIDLYGGRAALQACGRVTVDQSYQAHFAWRAGMTDVEVRRREPPTVAFAIAGHGLQRRLSRFEFNERARLRLLGAVGPWRIVAVEPWDRRTRPACGRERFLHGTGASSRQPAA